MRRRPLTHKLLIDDVIEHLRYHYDYIEKNLSYHVNNYYKEYYGEFDVMATRAINNNRYHHYYEVKSSDSPQARARAARQFERVYKAFPLLNWKFIYVTPQKIIRYKMR